MAERCPRLRALCVYPVDCLPEDVELQRRVEELLPGLEMMDMNHAFFACGFKETGKFLGCYCDGSNAFMQEPLETTPPPFLD